MKEKEKKFGGDRLASSFREPVSAFYSVMITKLTEI